jgi:Domain of unknown function (DUF4115)
VAKQQVVDVALPGLQVLRGINVVWLAGALVVSLVLGLFIWMVDGEPAVKASEVVVESVPLPVVTEESVSAVAAPPTISKTVEVHKAVEPVKVVEKTVAPLKVMTQAPVAATEAKPPVSLEMLKRRPLHFMFTGAAWIEVIDVNGDILLSRSNLGGTEKWIGGPRRAPYDISIGNPGNVKLFYKGKEIDLSAYAGMDTARLKVE